MSCSYYRWDKCHVLTIGGTKVGVAQKSGWHKCHVALMSVGQMSVGQMSVAQNSRHRVKAFRGIHFISNWTLAFYNKSKWANKVLKKTVT